MTKRIGKTTDDIFRATTLTKAKTPGRPTGPEPWEKVTVCLLTRQVAQLDRLAADFRGKTGVAVSRAEVIRALLDAATDKDLEKVLEKIQTEKAR